MWEPGVVHGQGWQCCQHQRLPETLPPRLDLAAAGGGTTPAFHSLLSLKANEIGRACIL